MMMSPRSAKAYHDFQDRAREYCVHATSAIWENGIISEHDIDENVIPHLLDSSLEMEGLGPCV